MKAANGSVVEAVPRWDPARSRLCLPPHPRLPRPPRLLSHRKIKRYFDLLGGIENESRTLILSPDDSVVRETPVKEMIDTILALEIPAKTVIFDGIVSQRLLDVVREKGIDTVVANRVGAVGKVPDGLRVLTKVDLQMPTGR